jgi:uncharacterized membrane protein (DUF106 family)
MNMAFENLLNPLLDPLLKLPSIWAIVILSFGISLIITLIYKYTTNQNLMRDLKNEMKEFQKQIKELRHDPQRAMEIQKKSMKTNMKYMSHSLRSTLFTFIPIILIFGWMNAHLAFTPILPGQSFTTTVVFEEDADGKIELSVPEGLNIEGEAVKKISKETKDNEVKWLLNGDEGEYLLEYTFNNKKYNHEVLITNKNTYKAPIKAINDGSIRLIRVDLKKNIVLNLGFWKIGWLGTYIIFSLVFSILLRKIMKVY